MFAFKKTLLRKQNGPFRESQSIKVLSNYIQDHE